MAGSPRSTTPKVELTPTLVDIEAEIKRLKPEAKRATSARSGLIAQLTERLDAVEDFTDVVYLEGRHVSHQSVDRYLGLWRSANDVQAQLGTDLFERFMRYAQDRLSGLEHVEVTYLTTLWAVRRA
ncbi:hypothetical protein ACWED2_10110 [Amycolatopsis sp. NPDC005003]